MERITKKDLSIAVAETLATTKTEGINAVNAVSEEIQKALSEGKTIDIAGFGKFEILNKPERDGINPFTKEKIVIPAKNAVKFKPSKALKDSVN